MTKNDKSLAVVMSLLKKVVTMDNKGLVLESVLKILVDNGVCTEEEIQQRHSRWESMLRDIDKELSNGLDYISAYRKVVSNYAEFNLINLN